MTVSLPICGHRGDVTGERCVCRSNRWMHDGTVPLALCETCRYADMPLIDLQALRQPATSGPGTELKGLLSELGLTTTSGCGCDDKARQMDAWGIDGCRERRAEIIAWLRDAKSQVGSSWDIIAAVGRAVVRMLPISPLDPYGSLVDEAIRRAEPKV